MTAFPLPMPLQLSCQCAYLPHSLGAKRLPTHPVFFEEELLIIVLSASRCMVIGQDL